MVVFARLPATDSDLRRARDPRRGEEVRAAVELIDDLEYGLFPLFRGVCSASSMPMRRCASARSSFGISE